MAFLNNPVSIVKMTSPHCAKDLMRIDVEDKGKGK